MRRHYHIRVKLNRDAFKKKLGIKDGETPIVDYPRIEKNVLKRVRIPKDGKDGADGKDGSKGEPGIDGSPDTAAEIVRKINSLPAQGPKIDAQHIINLIQSLPLGGFNQVVLRGGSNVTVTQGSDGAWTISVSETAGILIEFPVGLINSSNLNYTVTNRPKRVFVDGMGRRESVGYTISGAGPYTIAVDPLQPPTYDIFSLY